MSRISNIGIVFSIAMIVLSGCSQTGKTAAAGYFDKLLYEDRSYSSEIVRAKKSSSTCPAWSAGETVRIEKSVTLPRGCAYERVTLRIAEPNITFDCNGAIFNGLSKRQRNPLGKTYSQSEKPKFDGIIISGSEKNKQRRTENINIRNCHFINYVNAVSVTYALTKKTGQLLREGKLGENNIRKFSPRNIFLANSKLLDSHKHGIYLHRYITDFTLQGSEIKGSGNSAVYLEAGTKRAKIFDNIFEGNGFSSYSHKNGLRTARRTELSRREALAIDSSTHNVVKRNVFRGNGDGGIYLYKNCWEHANKPEQLPRTDGADYNIIEGNTFIDETTGVWLAERADRDLSSFQCGDPVLSRDGNEVFYRDYASHNTVRKNTFEDVDTGVIVHDDNNTIRENTFKNVDKKKAIVLGSRIRQLKNRPVSGNKIVDNVFITD